MTTTKNAERNGGSNYAYDEVSIIQLLYTIGKRWKVVAVTVVVFVLVSLGYSYWKAELYEYEIDIEIGAFPPDLAGDTRPIVVMSPSAIEPRLVESMSVVLARLETEWIPAAVKEVVPNGTEAGLEYLAGTEARDRSGSNVVRIRNTAPLGYGEEVKAVLARTALMAADKHSAVLDSMLKKTRRELRHSEQDLSLAQEELTAVEERIGRLEGVVTEREGPALAAAIELNALMQNRSEARSKVEELGNVRRKREEEMEVLKSAVGVFRAGELDKEVLRKQDEAAATLETTLRFRPTRILNMPESSIRPVSIQGRIIVLLALALGLGAGVVLALIAEGLSQERNSRGV